MKYHIVYSKTGIFNNDLFMGEFETISEDGCKGTFSKNDYFDIIVYEGDKKTQYHYRYKDEIERNPEEYKFSFNDETGLEHNTNSKKYFLEENDDLMEVLAERFRIFRCKYKDFLQCTKDLSIARNSTMGLFGYLEYDHAAWEDYTNIRMGQQPFFEIGGIFEAQHREQEWRAHFLVVIDDMKALMDFYREMDIAFTDEDMARLEVITVEY